MFVVVVGVGWMVMGMIFGGGRLVEDNGVGDFFLDVCRFIVLGL